MMRLIICDRCHGTGEKDCERGNSRGRRVRCGRCEGTGTIAGRPRGDIGEDRTPVSNRALHDADGSEL